MQITQIEIVNITDNNLIKNFISDCMTFMTQDEFDHIVFEDFDDKKEVLLSFNTEYITDRLIAELKMCDMYISHNNITAEVLENYECDNNDVNYNNLFSSDMYLELLPLFQEYFTDNLTQDNVLDKILKSGINTLTDIDKFVLNK